MIENTIAEWHKLIKTKDRPVWIIFWLIMLSSIPRCSYTARGKTNHQTLSYRGTLCFQ